MLPFKSELTAFFSFYSPFLIFFHTLCPPHSFILTHTQVFSFFLFFVCWWGEWLDRDRGREGQKQGESVSEGDMK